MTAKHEIRSGSTWPRPAEPADGPNAGLEGAVATPRPADRTPPANDEEPGPPGSYLVLDPPPPPGR